MMNEQKIAKPLKITALDEKHVGPEPDWDPLVDYPQEQYIAALNWYNYILSPEDRLSIVAKALSEPKVKDLDPSQVPNSMAARCRMILRGYTFSREDLERHRLAGEKILNAVSNLVAAKPSQSVVRKPAPPSTSAIIADLDDVIDDEAFRSDITKVFRGKYDPETIRVRYTALAQELVLAIDGGDPQVTEAYRRFKKKTLRDYLEFVQRILDNVEVRPKSNERKPRKKKVLPPEKLVAKLKHQPEDASLNLKGVAPKSLVGAKEAWVYNTKTRLLIRFLADDGQTISVNRSALTGCTGFAKKLRKPEELATSVPNIATLRNFYASLKTKPWPASNRFNEQMIILKVKA